MGFNQTVCCVRGPTALIFSHTVAADPMCAQHSAARNLYNAEAEQPQSNGVKTFLNDTDKCSLKKKSHLTYYFEVLKLIRFSTLMI